MKLSAQIKVINYFVFLFSFAVTHQDEGVLKLGMYAQEQKKLNRIGHCCLGVTKRSKDTAWMITCCTSLRCFVSFELYLKRWFQLHGRLSYKLLKRKLPHY